MVQKTTAETVDPTIPTDKVKVDDPKNLTDEEKDAVKDNLENANKDENGNSTLPDGTEITIGDDGTTTITYPDGSKDTIPGGDLVEGKTDAEKTTPTVPGEKTKVDDPTNLTDTEKDAVKDAVEDANKDENGKSTLPDGTEVTVGDDGTTTITYPDGSKDTIPGGDLVEGKTDAEKTTPTVPDDKTKVDDPTKLTDAEKDTVKDAIEDANKDKDGNSTLPKDTEITIGNDGTATITYPDGSKDTISGDDLIEGKTDAEKTNPTVPGDKTKVDDPTKLTDSEKDTVKDAIEDANKDKDGNSTLPKDTEITIGDDGTATITYPDGSKDTISGGDLVEGKTDAEKYTPNLPGTKTKVDDKTSLTTTEKTTVKGALETANTDSDGSSTLPEGTTITIGDDGTATVTYPDQSTDTIAGDQLVEEKTTADKTTPSLPDGKVAVEDPSHLTDSEKDAVKDAVEDANKDENGESTLPDGTEVTVGDDGTTTITYPDGSKDTISGGDLVEGKTDADKTTPTVPDSKVTVEDPTKLTDSEKDAVKDAVEDANKDENGNSTLPDGTEITVGDDGTATITYPDGSKDTISGDDLVEGKTDADKVTPSLPGTKVKVDDTSALTDAEKDAVKEAIEKANTDSDGKSTLPSGTEITIGDDGTATITYPDGSTDTISGSDLVEAKTDAEKTTPLIPGEKVPVANPSHLTDAEKDAVKKAVEAVNPTATVTVADDGTATLTYADGSTNTIAGDQLVVKAAVAGAGSGSAGSSTATPSTGTSSNKQQASQASNPAKQGPAASQSTSQTKQLPQTGNEDQASTTAAGLLLALASFIGGLGFLGGKKKRED